MFTCIYGVAAVSSAVHKVEVFEQEGTNAKLPGKETLTSIPALLACNAEDV
jgi:hypothetical protein